MDLIKEFGGVFEKLKTEIPDGFSIAASAQVSFCQVTGYSIVYVVGVWGKGKQGEIVSIHKAGDTKEEACDAVISALEKEKIK